MNIKLLWLAVVGLTVIVVHQGVNAYQPPPQKPKGGYLSAPAGVWTQQDGTKLQVQLLFFEDGTTGWSAQPVEEKPVLQLGK